MLGDRVIGMCVLLGGRGGTSEEGKVIRRLSGSFKDSMDLIAICIHLTSVISEYKQNMIIEN